MKKAMILMLAAVALFVGAIGSVKVLQIKSAMAHASFQPPPEAVTTVVVKEESWPAELNAIGTVEANHGVTVSADLPGVVRTIEFESGRRVAAGAVLVRLDTSQEEAQLAAAEAQRDLTRLSLGRQTGLRSKGITSGAEYDRAAAEARQAEARVAEIRAAIARKTIRAPFAGILGIRQVNLGQYLAGGDPVVPLQSVDPVYVNFGVPQQELHGLRPGVLVRVEVEGSADHAGKITAVDSVVDPKTRNVQVQATFPNADGSLRPGMFVKARVALGAGAPVTAVPATAISYAPYGDSVYVVEEMSGPAGKSYRGVKQQFVKLGGARGDLVAVLSGLPAGAEVVTSGVFKLRNGAAVLVNNEVQPGSSPAPRPENS